jgi:hypothetical protein
MIMPCRRSAPGLPIALWPLPRVARPLCLLCAVHGAGRGWRIGQRIAIGAACFGALATTAAATGLLERFDIPVPSAEKVWASLTGGEAPAVAAPAARPPEAAAAAAVAGAPLAPVVIEGPIDTPEELAEAFRRIDGMRQGRSEVRRQVIDQRIDRVIERRRAAGLPVPDAEQEARLRQRIDEAQTKREGRAAQRIEERRDGLRQRVENGEALTRQDLAPNRQPRPGVLPDGRRLRDLSPQERREVLRSLTPDQRRALADELRQRREQRLSQPAVSDPAPAISDPASEPAVAPDASLDTPPL